MPEALTLDKHGFAEIEGSKEGPTIFLLGATHANEFAGTEAVKSVLANPPKLKAGRLIIALGNLKALPMGTRDTGVNLNRMYLEDDGNYTQAELNSYERQRALEIVEKGLKRSDILLDLHGTTNPITTVHAVGERNSYGVLQYLPANLTVSEMDRFEPGGSDHRMNLLGNIGICFEAGYNQDPESLTRALASVDALLKSQKMIPGSVAARLQRRIDIFYVYKVQTNHFELAAEFPDFMELIAGTLIARDGGVEVKTPNKPRRTLIMYAESPIIDNGIGEEAYLLAQDQKHWLPEQARGSQRLAA